MKKSGLSYQLDAIDFKILARLQQDARITNQELADSVGLSASPCLQRVKRLEREGIITRYCAHVDLSKIARHIDVIVTVTLANHTVETFQEFETKIRSMRFVVACSAVSGRFDYLVRFACPDIATYNMLQNELLQLGPKVENVASHIVLSDVKAFSGFALEDLTAAGD